jgi:hypothetical protein
MAMLRVHKAAGKYASGRVTHNRANRRGKQYSNRFVTVVFGVGVTLVLTFLLLTFAMVFLEALKQWRK